MNVVTTVYGREAMAKAHAGDASLPKITHIAFGVGGGAGVTPNPNATALTSEIIRKPVTSHSYPTSTTVRYHVDLTGDEIGGAGINEAALIDATGKAVAIQTFGTKTIEPGETVGFDWDEEF